MRMPKIGSRRHNMVMHFVESGPMTADEFIEKHTMMGIDTMRKFNNELSELRVSGLLTRSGNVYTANIKVWEPTCKDGELVQPRTVKPFTELNAKYFVPTVSPRGQELRKIAFIGLGASIVEPNRF